MNAYIVTLLQPARLVLEKLITVHPLEMFPTLYGIPRFITILTRTGPILTR
jgi:hypothetical protein